ncbi:uncharacterized protein LOC117117396 [Anneissia japonica]|uniref:uncharacterized protein LOC117117396 n=1 Tax=Anneissia japonica TaxID=1529436 RepID=UPI001425943A|nr:uncharacterized protein LOC117117396 [Anneissia japonica]
MACTEKNQVVCEKDFEISSVVSDNIYYYLSGNMTFSEAHIACKNIGADLPVITSKEKNDAFHFTDFSFWLALNDNDTDSNYVWSTRIGDYPVKEHDFTAFPAWNSLDSDNCVIYFYGVWSHVNCEDKRLVVCERESCTDHLGVEDGTIPSERLTASTEFSPYYGAHRGRLNIAADGNLKGAWSAKSNDSDPWIQADLGSLSKITGVITQGREDASEWVTSFEVLYSIDGEQFETIMNSNGEIEVFTGNSDRNTSVENMFHVPVYAMVIRISPISWSQNISMRFEVVGCSGTVQEQPTTNSDASLSVIQSILKFSSESCVGPLGVEDGTIPSEQLTASSELNSFFGPDNWRLNTASTPGQFGAWSAAVYDQNQWIQADLGSLLMVTGATTQGRDGSGQWVTSYKVHYSFDGENFKTILNASGQAAVFTGNSDGNTAVTNMFHIPVYAQYIRINPISWMHRICMRFEVIGCSDPCIDPLGVEDGRISSTQLTASSEYSPAHAPDRGRLNSKAEEGLKGGWAAAINDQNQWIQADLGFVFKVTGVITQGRREHSQWVKSFEVLHSIHGDNFETILNATNQVAVFTGNSDGFTKVTNLFHVPVYAKFIRIHPISYETRISMRFEVLGCSANLIQLVDGNNTWEGRLEIMWYRTECNDDGNMSVCKYIWERGTVCNNYFDEAAGDVTCRSLGYDGLLFYGDFGQGNGPIWFDSVRCNGSETYMWDCGLSLVENNCSHAEDVGVACDITKATTVSQTHRHDTINTYSYLLSDVANIFSPSDDLEELQALYELEHMLLETEWNSSLETIIDFSREIQNVSLLLFSSDSVKTTEDTFKIVSMNEFLFKLVGSNLPENIGIDLTSDHQSVHVQKLSSTNTKFEFDIQGGENCERCSVSLSFMPPIDDFTIFVIIYQDLPLFVGTADITTSAANEIEDSLIFASGILTITLYDLSLQKIPISVNFTIHHLENVTEDIYSGGLITQCAFWHEEDKVWSETGCQTVHEQDSPNSTKCVCDHTTSYALLVGNDVISTTNRAISMLTTILCCCSVCCLIVMLLIYVSFEALRNSEKNHIHKNLLVALFLAQVLFLTAVENTSSKGVCTVVAVVLHYLYLSVFTWMTIEGLNLYLKIVRVFNSDLLSMRAYMVIGWGVPILIVAIAVTCNIEGYGMINGEEQYICWIDIKSPLLYAFIVPVFIAVLVNSVVSIFVWRIIYLKTDSNNRWKDARSSLKGVIMLSPILGLPWIFGLFARNSSVAIGTIFTVCNAPQGVFLFFTHCLFSNEVRTAMKMHWSKRKARFSVQPQTKSSNVLPSEQN